MGCETDWILSLAEHLAYMAQVTTPKLIQTSHSNGQMTSSQSPHGLVGDVVSGGQHEEVIVLWAGTPHRFGKTTGLQGIGQHLEGETTTMGHVQIARSHRATVAIQDVQSRDGARRGVLQMRGQGPFGHLRTDRLQVWASDQDQPVRFENTHKFGQGQRHFMGVQMLDVVA